MRYAFLIALLWSLTSTLSLPATAAAQGQPPCQFVLGFAALHASITTITGNCLDDEQHNPANGDALQHTATGLLVWRKADNFTAFTDGQHTWVAGPYGVAERLNGQRYSWEANPDGLPTVPALPAVQPGIQEGNAAGLVATTLQVPAADQSGVFAQPRTVYLPPGYHISVFAAGLADPRGLAFSPQGDLYVSLETAGRVIALPDRQHTGAASQVVGVASGLLDPFGLAFHDGALFVGETTQVDRFQVDPASLQAGNGQVVIAGLPADGRHITRTLQFGPDGKLYVSIGSSCDVCVESDARRAAIMEFNSDGSGGRIYAQGMRNAVGFTFQPGTGLLWATVNGQDTLGDNQPGEDVTVVQAGDNFGWPYCYGDQQTDPELTNANPTYCSGTTAPTVQLHAHMAPLGTTFATSPQLPAGQWGSLLVALHGSMQSAGVYGYKIMRVGMEGGQPAGVSDFATGWLTANGYWGRPVAIVQGPDGAWYVSDDQAGAVYRIWYDGQG
jgi:glucose/arabinose dehydrogenase